MVRKVGAGGPAAGGELVEVGVWKDTCQAIDQGDAVASWLQAFLGVVSRVRQNRAFRVCVCGGGGKGKESSSPLLLLKTC